MSKHTPGPWVQTPWDSTAIFDAKNLQVPIAQTYPADTSQKEAEANARLVAAAPQLLEALELIVEQDPDGEGQGFIDARAAIKAAK
jgi:hypothetical protein